jgi:hypothetical protein
MFKKANFP